MFTKSQFLAACAREFRILRHLAGRVPSGGLAYRPTPAQRSTLELLRYLTTCAIVPARAMVEGSWDRADAAEAEAATLEAADVDAALVREEADLRALVEPLTDDALASQDAVLPWGERCPLGLALVETVLKTLTAYRMQLFLYAKAAGNAALGPADCWVGVSAAGAA